MLFFIGLNYINLWAVPILTNNTYDFIPVSNEKKPALIPLLKASQRPRIQEKSVSEKSENQSDPIKKGADFSSDSNLAQADSLLPVIQPDNLLSQGVRIVNISSVTESVKRTPEAILNNIEGKIRLKLLIDEKGQLRKITAMNSLGYGLDEVAMHAAQKLIFLPARIKLEPVAVEIYYTVKFTVSHH